MSQITTCDKCGETTTARGEWSFFTHVYFYRDWDFCQKCSTDYAAFLDE